MAGPIPRDKELPERLRHERRRQLRGLILLALVVLLFGILRAGVSHVFPAGWWRLW